MNALGPSSWRPIIALWPDNARESWGRLANDLEAKGLSWKEAEFKAFKHVLKGLEKYDAANPGKIIYRQPYVDYLITKQFSSRLNSWFTNVTVFTQESRNELDKFVAKHGIYGGFDPLSCEELAELETYSKSLPALVDPLDARVAKDAVWIAKQRRRIEAWVEKKQAGVNHGKAAPENEAIVEVKKRKGGRRFKHDPNTVRLFDE